MTIDPKLQAALDAYALHLANDYNKWTTPEHVARANYNITFEPGSKYIRVVASSHGSRSAHSFVDYNGLIWKTASWKAPAKNFPRGSVYDPASYASHRWSGGMEKRYVVPS